MIKGFEDDVGTKTSFYGFTVNTMKNSLISYRELGFTSVPQGQVRPLLGATVPRAPPRGRHRVPQAQPSGTEQPWTGAGVASVHCRLTGCQAIHVGPVSLVRRLRLGALHLAKQQEGWGSSLGSPPRAPHTAKGCGAPPPFSALAWSSEQPISGWQRSWGRHPARVTTG